MRALWSGCLLLIWQVTLDTSDADLISVSTASVKDEVPVQKKGQ